MKTFTELQTKWRTAADKLEAIQYALRSKYTRYLIGIASTEQSKLDRARAAESKASDAVYEWLDVHSPRDWRYGVPCSYVCRDLTEADAITTGELSVIPPVCFGGTVNESRQFAAAVAGHSSLFASVA